MRILNVLLALALFIMLAACDSRPDKPYLKIQGGGFVFNYRYSSMSYGFVAKVLKPLPEGSLLEASFDMPGSAERFAVKVPTNAGKMIYAFESPPLKGVQKGRPYNVTLRLLAGEGGQELLALQQTYKTDTDQAELPVKAPVKQGPGYEPNPD
jgi:hypothetical protein